MFCFWGIYRWIFFPPHVEAKAAENFLLQEYKMLFLSLSDKMSTCIQMYTTLLNCIVIFFLGVEIATSCVGQATDLHHWDLSHIGND